MNKSLRATVQLLRFHFSFFLMPVYWFALACVPVVNWQKAGLLFFILHILVYPASNGYNSYMDRDTTPIGGLEAPPLPTRMLYNVSVGMNLLALLLAYLVSPLVAIGIIFYIAASLAYSYRGIRLKKYPFVGFTTVVLCQGALVFFLTYLAAGGTGYPLWQMLAASLLIAGAYPITQVYQHEADKADGVVTFSYFLGYRGTFVFTGIVYALVFLVLARLFFIASRPASFFIWALCMLPVVIYFMWWFVKEAKDERSADFKNTMRMTLVSSGCSNVAFILILINNHLE